MPDSLSVYFQGQPVKVKVGLCKGKSYTIENDRLRCREGRQASDRPGHEGEKSMNLTFKITMENGGVIEGELHPGQSAPERPQLHRPVRSPFL